MRILVRGGTIDWDQLRCCRSCFITYVHYLLTGIWLQQITPTREIRIVPAGPPNRHGPMRDYAHVVLNGQPIPTSFDVADPRSTERRSTTRIGWTRRQVPPEYVEVNGKPYFQLTTEYITSIGHPRRFLWFPPHVRLQDGTFAIRLPEWSRAPCGPFLTVEEVFEVERRRGRIIERRKFTAALFGLPMLALICFAIFFFGWFKK